MAAFHRWQLVTRKSVSVYFDAYNNIWALFPGITWKKKQTKNGNTSSNASMMMMMMMWIDCGRFTSSASLSLPLILKHWFETCSHAHMLTWFHTSHPIFPKIVIFNFNASFFFLFSSKNETEFKAKWKKTKEKTKLEACHEIAKKRILQLIFRGEIVPTRKKCMRKIHFSKWFNQSKIQMPFIYFLPFQVRGLLRLVSYSWDWNDIKRGFALLFNWKIWKISHVKSFLDKKNPEKSSIFGVNS